MAKIITPFNAFVLLVAALALAQSSFGAYLRPFGDWIIIGIVVSAVWMLATRAQ